MSATTSQNPAERTTHSYPGSQYLLPSDEEERERLSRQHQVYTDLIAGRLVLPPISFSEKDEVLEIGVGTGAWLLDVRTHLPKSVQLYGVDIEPRLFPSYTALSSNVHLSVCSATNLPSYWTDKFALVHQRLLIFGYTREEWRHAIGEMYRVVKPGGYVQLIENGPRWVSGPKTAKHILFLDDFLESKNMLCRCGIYIADMLTAAGFVDVKSERVDMNLGKWSGGQGIEAKYALLGAWRGARDSVMQAGGLGRFASVGEFDKALDEIAEEWDSVDGSYSDISVFYARKPL